MSVKKISKKEKDFITSKKENTKKNNTDSQLVTLRIPEDLLEKIDIKVLSRPLKVSRNMWILETLHAALCDSDVI